MLASEVEAEKDKKMLELDSVLEQIILSRKANNKWWMIDYFFIFLIVSVCE